VTRTPTPNIAGGFKLLLEQEEVVRQALGDPIEAELGGKQSITEQHFRKGSMFYFKPTERIYVLFGSAKGTWKKFEQSEVEQLPTPAPSTCDVPMAGGFARIWGSGAALQEQLGCPVAPMPDLFEGAYQPFVGGTLLWSQKGLGRGPTIYVLYKDGQFERYDDPNQ
jgi:hypothetical protein